MDTVLPSEEERSHGRISFMTYYHYFKAGGGYIITSIFLLSIFLAEVRKFESNHIELELNSLKIHENLLWKWVNKSCFVCVYSVITQVGQTFLNSVHIYSVIIIVIEPIVGHTGEFKTMNL